MKRLTAISDVGEAYYPYCYRADTCDGKGETEKCRNCEFSEKICKTLAAYENTGLTPEEAEKVKYLGPAVDRMQELFGDKLSVAQVINGFVEFYLAEQGGRATDAVLLINEDVAEWQKLKERDTAKDIIHVGERKVWYRCPVCEADLSHIKSEFCPFCGQRLKWMEEW